LPQLTLSQLSQQTGARLVGDGNKVIHSAATLEDATDGQISFLANQKYKSDLSLTGASAVILREEDAEASSVDVLIHPNPHLCYALVTRLLYPEESYPPGVSEAATISASARYGSNVSIASNVTIGDDCVIGDDVFIGPGCVLMHGAQIHDGTILKANVTVYQDVSIGKRCIIHAGAVLGSDGLGFAKAPEKWVKVPQIGSLIIGDDV
jgi:UDP-3-O-[3-hydroxymyristoyl] glucosamine N-acyltransferase